MLNALLIGVRRDLYRALSSTLTGLGVEYSWYYWPPKCHLPHPIMVTRREQFDFAVVDTGTALCIGDFSPWDQQRLFDALREATTNVLFLTTNVELVNDLLAGWRHCVIVGTPAAAGLDWGIVCLERSPDAVLEWVNRLGDRRSVPIPTERTVRKKPKYKRF